jgi:ABC-type polysaccharide/polyol phosphate export permease
MSFLRDFFVLPITEFIKYKELIFFQVKSDFKERHVQRALGPLWWFGQPLLMALLFIFVTTVLFKSTFAEHHLLSVVMAILVWQWFLQSVNGAPDLLLGFQAELSSTNLPILPLLYSRIIVEFTIFCLSLIIIFVGAVIDGVQFTENLVFVPVLILLQIAMTVTFVTHLSRWGLFYRDLSQVLWFFVAIWFFVSPGAYPKIAIPQDYMWLYDINPWATIFPAWRDSLIVGNQPDMMAIGVWLLIFVPLAFWGLWKINKSRGAFYRRL